MIRLALSLFYVDYNTVKKHLRGGAAETEAEQSLLEKLIRTKNINLPVQSQKLSHTLRLYDQMTPEMKKEARQLLPKKTIDELERVSKKYKKPPVPKSEKDKIKLKYGKFTKELFQKFSFL
jgi:hypothetical protein